MRIAARRPIATTPRRTTPLTSATTTLGEYARLARDDAGVKLYVSLSASMTLDSTHANKHSGALPHDPRVDQLIARLPRHLNAAVRYLRRPRSVWMRRAAAMLLICGGLLGFLPILGFWMLPIGLLLLAEDVPPLRSARTRVLDWIEGRHPDWFISQR